MVAARLQQLFLLIIWLHLCFLHTHALYTPPASSLSRPAHLHPRKAVVVTSDTGNITIVDSASRESIPQGAATDGAGEGLTSLTSILWICFCFLVGVPMSFAGIRGWRLTTGVGVGVSAGVMCWAAFINSVDERGVSDIVLTAVVLGFMTFGFCIGVFEFARIAAIVLLCINGGLAFGIRIAVIKDSLLVEDPFFVNWLIAAICGGIAGLTSIWHQRWALLFGCASIGTFFLFLGVDLVMNKQEGLSRGLRFLFDRNANHLADIITNGYHPTLATRILIYVSLGSTPFFAFVQHRIFRDPFTRRPPPPSDAALSVNYPSNLDTPIERLSRYISDIWDRNPANATEKGGNKLKSAHRFSL